MSKAAAPRRFLFVCTGNTCRSPMAQFLFARMSREAGLPWTAASAGVAAAAGAPLSAGAADALAARGLSGLRHASRPVDAALLAESDAVYVLESAHAAVLEKRFPAAAGKVKLLRAAAGLEPADVDDPMGEDPAVYTATLEAIEEALEIILEKESHASHPR